MISSTPLNYHLIANLAKSRVPQLDLLKQLLQLEARYGPYKSVPVDTDSLQRVKAKKQQIKAVLSKLVTEKMRVDLRKERPLRPSSD